MESRVRMIRKELNLTQEALAQRLGIGKSALSMIETGKAALSERNKKILLRSLNVNPQWLETGKGDMFIAPPDLTGNSGDIKTMSNVQGTVPLYDIDNGEGLMQLFLKKDAFPIQGYIYIPNLPKCDGAINVIGDSMYPQIKSGDIVMFKQLTSIEDVFWGDMYLISIDINGEEYITVKYILKSDREDYVRLVSQNKMHADKEIETYKIKAIALVKATVSINTLR